MRKLFNILLLFSLLAGPVAVWAGKDTLTADFADFKLPQYDDKGKLIFILYGKNGKTVGVTVVLDHILLDLVRRDVVDIDTVKDFSAIVPYPLDTPRQTVLNFWLKYPHSQALIATSNATFDRVANSIKGGEKVMFRSAMLDIDGVGFDADYVTKTIHIRKDVKMVVRYDLVPKPGKSDDGSGAAAKAPARKTATNNEKKL